MRYFQIFMAGCCIGAAPFAYVIGRQTNATVLAGCCAAFLLAAALWKERG